MPHVRKPDDEPLLNLNLLAVGAGAQELQEPLHVLEIIDRLHVRLSGASGLAALPLGLGELDVRRVLEHDVAEVARRLRGVHRAAKALLVEQRQQPRVVQMRVRHEHELERVRRRGDRDVFKHVAALLHAAVDEAQMPSDLQHRAAAGHLMVCANECELHTITSFSLLYRPKSAASN